MEVGHAYRSGLLAVEFAYRCAERWPCVVLADITVNRKPESKIYTREEIMNLYAEEKAFSTYGMLEEDYDDDDDDDE